MSVKTETYSACYVSRLLGADRRTVQIWCMNDKIKANRSSPSGNWHISYKALVNFLQKNPKYFERMKKEAKRRHKHSESKILVDAIVEEMSGMIKVYTSNMLADRLGVDRRAVRYWVKQGWITPCEGRSASHESLFTEIEIMRFLRNQPKYIDIWEEGYGYEN